jgi:hypothetical protein
MTQAEAVAKALQAFPKIYYFVPIIKAFEVDVPSAKRRSSSKAKKTKKLQIRKPLDAILWMIDSLCAQGNGYCSQLQVQQLVSRWTKLNFNKEIGKLYDADLIDGRDDPANRQKRQLKLTRKGRNTLDRVKNQRKEVLRLLFDKKKLDEQQMEAIASSIEIIASATWPIMNQGKTSL